MNQADFYKILTKQSFTNLSEGDKLAGKFAETLITCHYDEWSHFGAGA
jgi:hypothetical protein